MMIEVLGIPLSVWVVLTSGIFFGSIVKGITGFGSTIAHLCIWSVCKGMGFPAGTMQQAVLAECIYRASVSLPLLVMTRAHRTADAKLVGSLTVFQAAGAPLGASLLAVLDQRVAELVLGIILLLVIMLQYRLPQRMFQAASTCCGVCTSRAADARVDADLKQPLLLPFEAGWEKEEASRGTHRGLSHGVANTLSLSCLPAALDTDRPFCPPAAAEHAMALAASGSTAISFNSGSHNSRHSEVQENTAVAGAIANKGSLDRDTIVSDVLLAQQHTLSLSSSSSTDSLKADDAHVVLHVAPHPHGGATAPETAGRTVGPAAHAQQGSLQTCKLFMVGSVAGTLSGIMAGLTGICGPPIMLMFNLFEVPKEVARGSNAVINLLLMHWLLVNYLLVGVLREADAPLFTVAAVVGLVGTWIGNRIANRMDQAAFNWAQNTLVVVCCIMMFGSALGLVD